ncbi:hypothetical protein [Streptomyces broussonetiae]|uniref:Transposase IS204/IS1001/IS1096/IS1165 DDE domain-containing protein n=1 Tax=Streptomyces broussonetiae TaxID=2686304 RepID=A0ABV5EME3_9ACTN
MAIKVPAVTRRERGPAPRGLSAHPPGKALSVRDVTVWLARQPERLTNDQAQKLKAITACCPALDRIAHDVRAFAQLMNDRQGEHLNEWITQVQADELPALHTFVTGSGSGP